MNTNSQVFYHYTLWEDWINGMYSKKRINEDALIENCYTLLCDPDRLYSSMVKVIENWPLSSSQNLSNPNINKQAWLGQSACCFEFKANAYTTKISWSKLTNEQKILANESADKSYRYWAKINNSQISLF